MVLNISSDAAVNAYPTWGAYGASKAALRHLTARSGTRSLSRTGRAVSVGRSGRHGYADARAGGARCGHIDAEATGRSRRASCSTPSPRAREPRRRRMIAAASTGSTASDAKLLVVDPRQAPSTLASATHSSIFCRPAICVVANDAATLAGEPARHHAPHGPAYRSAAGRRGTRVADDVAISPQSSSARATITRVLSTGPPPPPLAPGDRLVLGPLSATVTAVLGHPRLVALHFDGSPETIWAGIAQPRQAIQYAHVDDAAGAVGCVDEVAAGRLRSSRRRPVSRSTGRRSRDCARAASISRPSLMPPASPRRATRTRQPTPVRRAVRHSCGRPREPSRARTRAAVGSSRSAQPSFARSSTRQCARCRPSWSGRRRSTNRRRHALRDCRRNPFRHARARHEPLRAAARLCR